ncbi:MAG TPA: T9SS type A sorting domain-containing protein, partial [Arachidicoccus soli]|nr:T9SS type A sorting domain-containing protein [Arachidicoccus soli]
KPLSVSKNKMTNLIIAPNPTKGAVNISSNDIISHIEIYSIEGHLIQSVPVQSKSIEINLNGVSPGMYLMKVKSGQMVTTKRIIKE